MLPVACAIRVCAKNVEAFTAALEASAALDGKLNAFLCVGIDDGFVWKDSTLKAVAEAAFASVAVREFDAPPASAWPHPQNVVWQQTARWFDSSSLPVSHWLWWESDCTPIRKGWLKALSDVASSARTPFLGVPCTTPDGQHAYMNGVGLWPVKSLDLLADTAAYYCRETPFDIAAGSRSRRNFTDISNLMVHAPKPYGGAAGESFDATSFAALLAQKPEAVFYHGCADQSLAQLVRKGGIVAAPAPARPSTSSLPDFTFYHSGDLGDIVHSLWTVKLLGGGKFLTGPDQRVAGRFCGTRVRMDERHASFILPLVESQPYIASASFAERMPVNVTHDFNQFRPLFFGGDYEQQARQAGAKTPYSIARAMGILFGLKHVDETEPWLTIPDPITHKDHPVIINVTERYHNPRFDWRLIIKRYGKKLLFLGLKEEYECFKRIYETELPWVETRNLLDAARHIAGAQLYIGNQSSPCAIAEGLKKPLIQCTCTTSATAVFDRLDALYCHGQLTEAALDDLDKRIAAPKVRRPYSRKEIIIRCPVDAYSGYGQMSSEIALGLQERGHSVKIAPSIYIKPNFQNDISPVDERIRRMLIDSSSSGVNVIIETHEGTPAWVRGGEVCMSMWESTRISTKFRDALNRCSHAIVPTMWNATLYNAGGIDTPISIVPLGVDPSIYKRSALPPTKPFVFGTAGRWSHGGCRKGLEDVIKAFLTAFPKRTDVRLHVKCFADCKISVPGNDPRVILDRKFYPNLADYYKQLHCYVCASRGEGWGYHLHHAMAMGRPVISTRFGAFQEFFDDSCGWCLDYELVPGRDFYKGMGIWAEPSASHLVQLMQHVVTHPKELGGKSSYAVKRAQTFTVSGMVDKFEAVLKRANII